MSERASQTAQRYVDAMNIASAKIEQLQAEVEALRAQVQRVRDAIEAELERHTLTNLGDFMFLDQALGRILNALDGDNDA